MLQCKAYWLMQGTQVRSRSGKTHKLRGQLSPCAYNYLEPATLSPQAPTTKPTHPRAQGLHQEACTSQLESSLSSLQLQKAHAMKTPSSQKISFKEILCQFKNNKIKAILPLNLWAFLCKISARDHHLLAEQSCCLCPLKAFLVQGE